MSVRSVLEVLLARVLGRHRSEPAAHDDGPSALAADDDTVALSASQAVTVPVERPPASRPSESTSRKPLPWPARDAKRLQRPGNEDEVGQQVSLPPVLGPDLDDVTAVVPSAERGEPQHDADVTVVWSPADADGRRPS